MVKSVIILKYRHGCHGPSARSLRRAIRPTCIKIGLRVMIFLVLLALAVGAVSIFLNLKIETWEREHPSASR